MNRRIVLCAVTLACVSLCAASSRAESTHPDASSGEAGTVAIVEAENPRLAAAMEPLFAQAGYRVTRVTWDDLQPGKLSTASFDLVLLADARRLPVSAVAPTTGYLRAGGRLIALGAPAFGELLVRSPQGYVPRDQYAAAVYDSLARRPLAVSPSAWSRSSSSPARPGAIEPDGQGWKVSVELDGWDTFGQSLAGGVPEGHSLVCLRARGDAQTPQLSIECKERDQSRWIATVELSTEWRSVVLRPTDFSFWPDAPVKRGRSGDRLNPANVASIQIGLSRTHTPRSESGPHTYWFQDLATAPDPNPDELDVSVPDLEGLCPSYKLYPVQGPFTIRPRSPGGQGKEVTLDLAAYAPVPRETGIGFDRHRGCRWVRALDAYDASNRNRGSVAWMMVGDQTLPEAAWGGIGLADPETLLTNGPAGEVFQPVLLDMARAMTRGCFLLEAGSRYFSYHASEPVELGALVSNSGRREQSLEVSFRVAGRQGEALFDKSTPLDLPPSERRETTCTWTPEHENTAQFPYTVTVELRSGNEVIDRVSHRLDLLPDRKAGPEEFVRVEGSRFTLNGKPWHMLGVNYWPNSQGGRPTVPYLKREFYNPEQIEQDLSWMEAAGINLLSGVQAPVPADADAPGAYRDLEDFLERCRRHGMKVFYFLYWGNPLHKPNLPVIQQHIDAAGLKDHPAILGWDLAWEPIYYAGPTDAHMGFLRDDWNTWIVDRYGSLADAERDWEHPLPRVEGKPDTAGLPDVRWCGQHGPWDRIVAAFRQFFSDRVGQGYADLIRELRRYDPNHLISFRFGACGIPNATCYAHAHSASVAKHVDFLCPEGYNLQTRGFTRATPADDVRQGGLVTLYYRFLSREKPVVWMEFGYTVNGMHSRWKTSDVRIKPAELAYQRDEYQNFYQMFLESGARGAAPWWLPGGYRLGEESDFGLLDPDGSERPACEVLKQALPKFAEVSEASCVASADSTPTIVLDFDTHYAEAWEFYGKEYLKSIKGGRVPYLRTEGTGTTSADCPLVAVGNTPLTGHNPPKYLNAEFNTVEVQSDRGEWRETLRGDEITLEPGDSLRCRVSVGNLGEASWEASGKPGDPGVVYLACRLEPSGQVLELPISAATPYLQDATVSEFAIPAAAGEQAVALQMCLARTKPDGTKLTIPFGENRRLTVKIGP
jgi:hypothetical protein